MPEIFGKQFGTIFIGRWFNISKVSAINNCSHNLTLILKYMNTFTYWRSTKIYSPISRILFSNYLCSILLKTVYRFVCVCVSILVFIYVSALLVCWHYNNGNSTWRNTTTATISLLLPQHVNNGSTNLLGCLSI